MLESSKCKESVVQEVPIKEEVLIQASIQDISPIQQPCNPHLVAILA
jgi:hypothetical protein